MTKIAVLGSGAWGTTLAVLMAQKRLAVTLWEHDPERATAMQQQRENRLFLPGIFLIPEIVITSDIATAMAGAEMVVFVVPSQRMRENVRLVAPLIAPDAIAISASKGFELHSRARMSQVLAQELPPGPREHIGVLSGPNLAREVAAGKPAASVIAALDAETAQRAQAWLTHVMFRIYTSDDVVGVEVGGALKNIIALAIGAVDGLGFGDNAKASLMTRGLAEMVRLAVAEGGQPLTLAGLAGLGDLIATCSSVLSRNYSLGRELTMTGRNLDALLAERHVVTEGVLTARSALEMAQIHGIQLPITQALSRLFDGADARTLVAELMRRDLRAEQDLSTL